MRLTLEVTPCSSIQRCSDCKVSNQSYNLEYTPACEAVKQDAVFILNSEAAVCKLPFVRSGPGSTANTSDCITVNKQLLSTVGATSYCNSHGDVVYQHTAGTGYNEVLGILTRLGAGTSNFLVGGIQTSAGTWVWGDQLVNTSFFVGAPPNGPSDPIKNVMFLNGSANFKIDWHQDTTFEGGVVCLKADVPE